MEHMGYIASPFGWSTSSGIQFQGTGSRWSGRRKLLLGGGQVRCASELVWIFGPQKWWLWVWIWLRIWIWIWIWWWWWMRIWIWWMWIWRCWWWWWVYFWRYRWFAHLRLPKCQKQLSRDVFCFSAWTMSEKVLRPHLIMAYPVPSAWRLSEDSKILPLWKPKLAGKSPFLLKLAGNLDSCKKHELSSSIFRKKWSTRGYLSTPPCVFRDGELATRRD